MDAEQFDRWLDFAQRMALRGHPGLTEARKQWLHRDVTDFIEYHREDMTEISDWDQGPYHLCDCFVEWFDDHYRHEEAPNRYYTLLECCIRAGIGTACGGAAGVIGYTIGDVRRMYDGQLPTWFVEQFADPYKVQTAPDDTGIWL